MKRVYFIRPVGMSGPIKIGCSAAPEKRRDCLDTWAPFPLEVVAQISGGFDLERRFHARFAEQHQRKEWFEQSPELTATIAQIRAGVFDISSLPAPRNVTGPPHTNRWTPEVRRRASLRHRIRLMEKRSGYRAPYGDAYRLDFDDSEQIVRLEAYLSDPAKHGVPYPYQWGEDQRAAYHAKLQAVA